MIERRLLPDHYAKKLYNDLCYAAPEMWKIHIERRMIELAEALDEDASTTPNSAQDSRP